MADLWRRRRLLGFLIALGGLVLVLGGGQDDPERFEPDDGGWR